MGKDPAFLFYVGDFNDGTQDFTNEEVGAYLRLLLFQFSQGHLPLERIQRKLGYDFDRLWPVLSSKFLQDSNGNYYNARLQVEQIKRREFCESRRENRNKGDMDNVHIYFILDKMTMLVKIGCSVDPNRRILELRKPDNNLELLFYTEKTSQTIESILHKEYKKYNVSYEWFDIYNIIEDVKNHMINDMNIHMT
jgi:hypothetical protein